MARISINRQNRFHFTNDHERLVFNLLILQVMFTVLDSMDESRLTVSLCDIPLFFLYKSRQAMVDLMVLK